MIFIGYPRCSTSNRAQAWLDANKVPYQFRHIKEKRPSIAELKLWHKQSGLPLKRFFNTSGLLYKSLGLKDRLPTLSEEEQYSLLASDGLLVKRPVLVAEDFVLVGFRENEWSEKLKHLIAASDKVSG